MALERQRFCNPRIPAAANHQKFPAHRADTLDRTTEILHQDNVAIDVAQDLVLRDELRSREQIVQPLGAVLVALHVRLVVKS